MYMELPPSSFVLGFSLYNHIDNEKRLRGKNERLLQEMKIEQESERKVAAAQIIQTLKLATLGKMATSVAHELNQPLNVIRMAAGDSRREISKGTADPEYLNDRLERIEEKTVRAAVIIDHIMKGTIEADNIEEGARFTISLPDHAHLS